MQKIYRNIIGTFLSIIATILIGAVFILLIGKDPFQIYFKLFSQTIGNDYGFGQVLFKATSLIFAGLSVAFAFKAGLFNIGAEGQLITGAFSTAWIGFTFQWLPAIILIPLSIFGGFIGGAIWGGIAGYLKARFGSHEVINTIMLNFIAAALVSYFINNVYNVESTIHSPEISQAAFIPRFDSFTDFFKGSPFNLSIAVALFCCIIMHYIVNKTPLGYEIRTIGLNKSAGSYAKMNIKKLTIISMLISGGFAGLAGINFVLGYKHYYELGFSEGTGYLGIAIALIAKNNSFAIVFVSIFFGILEYGGLAINADVPKELVTILQGLLIFFVIIFSKISEKKILFRNIVTGN